LKHLLPRVQVLLKSIVALAFAGLGSTRSSSEFVSVAIPAGCGIHPSEGKGSVADGW
jgi:hypothetical protein